MKLFSKRGNELEDQELTVLQAFLQSRLLPVEPRPDFVSGLRKRIQAEGRVESKSPQNQNIGLWVGMGVVTSLLVVATGIRAAIAIAALTGLFYQHRSQRKPERSIA